MNADAGVGFAVGGGVFGVGTGTLASCGGQVAVDRLVVPQRLSARRVVFIAAALALGWAAASGAWAQAALGDHRQWHRLPELQPLISYLRCEEVALDSFGQAQIPIEALSFVGDRLVKSRYEPSRERPKFPLEVWPGTQAQLQVLADYGSFGVLQFYPLSAKEHLLKALAAAGWEMKRVSPDDAPVESDARVLFQTYQARKPMGTSKVTRIVTLHTARVGFDPHDIDLDGLTLGCAYEDGGRRR